MPIHFICPHCGWETTVSDQYHGQTGPCAGCGKTVTILPVAGAPPNAAPAKRTGVRTLLIVVLAAALACSLLCVGALTALLLPAFQSGREEACRAVCRNNLKQLTLAMHCYHDSFKCFPPAYIPDEGGRPKHSWRVLLLRFSDEPVLYEKYNFNEPWDSPNNLALAEHMPDVFRCPSDTGAGPTDTNYVMIVGPDTISDGPTANSLRDMVDGSANTIMFVEVTGTGITWLEPRDLDAERISYRINAPDQPEGIGSCHGDGVNIGLCDGFVEFFGNSTDLEKIKAMSTMRGKDLVD